MLAISAKNHLFFSLVILFFALGSAPALGRAIRKEQTVNNGQTIRNGRTYSGGLHGYGSYTTSGSDSYDSPDSSAYGASGSSVYNVGDYPTERRYIHLPPKNIYGSNTYNADYYCLGAGVYK